MRCTNSLVFSVQNIKYTEGSLFLDFKFEITPIWNLKSLKFEITDGNHHADHPSFREYYPSKIGASSSAFGQIAL
jgi:hypothetical protein